MNPKLYYRVRSYASSSGTGYCFYCQIYDENQKPIQDHELNDLCLTGKAWSAIQRMMNKAERRCKENGIERVS